MKRKFSILMFVMFFSHALLFTQMIPYLTILGYSAVERGYIIAAYATFSMMGQIIFGYLSDRFGTIKKFVLFLTVIILATGLMGYSFHEINYLYHFVTLALVAGTTRIVANLFETWLLELDSMHDDFSYIRSFGSLGWALASLISGFMAVRLGYQSLGIVAAILSVLVLFIAASTEDVSKHSVEKLRVRDLKILFRNKRYLLLIVIFFFTYLIYNADGITITDYIFHLNGTSEDVGIKWFIQAITEIPLLFLGSYILSRFNIRNLFRLSLVIMMLRFILTGMSTSVWQVIAIASLQIFTFPIMLMAQKHLVFKEVPPSLKTSGQMVAGSLSMGLSAILAPLLSSFLMTFMDISYVLYVLGFILLIPIGLMAFYE